MFKRKIQTAAAVLALVMLTAAFTACSESTSSSSESSASSESSTSSASSEEESSSDTESEESSEVSSEESSEESDVSSEDEEIVEAVVGEITGIADDSLELYIYDVYPETTDYTDLTGETLTAMGETQTVTLDTGAAYEAVTDGAAEAITQADLAEGDMVAVITKEDGSQTVMVLEYDASADDTSSDAGDTTDTADDSSSDADTGSEAVEEAAGE